MILLFANNAVSTIASPINAAATAVQVATGYGAKFPNPVVGQEFFKLTFVDEATGLLTEIVNVTQRVGDVMTIVRGQEGTIALPWLAGDSAKNMTTAQTQANFAQIQTAQAGLYNFALDTGTPNSYAVALTPAVTTRIPGLYVRIKAGPGNTNNGPSTLNIGAGSFPITNPDGSSLGSNAIVGNGIFEVVDDGINYQLISASQEAQSSAGIATTGDEKFRSTSELIAGWIFANATTIGNAGSNATQLASPTAANLFAWHWNNFSPTQCPMFTSAGVPVARGLNPAADFAALRQITVLDKRGKGQIGVDTMGGAATALLSGVPVTSGAATIPGSILGQNLHALVAAELAVHAHANTLSDPTHAHSYTGPAVITGGTPNTSIFGTISTQSTAASATGVSINNANAGSGGAHNTVMLVMAGTWYLKL